MIMRVCLATYNIHSCVGGDGRYEPHRIVGVLKELEADAIALQEVDSREHRGLELLAHLAEETELQAIPGPTLLKQTGHYGNAILTRLPVRAVRRMDLSFKEREPRAIDADLDCQSFLMQLVATHLGLRSSERRFQVKYLLERVHSMHCALLGDFNEWFLWGQPLRWLKVAFGKTSAPATFPACAPCLALDRIWARPRNTILSLDAHKTRLARIASDHLPVKAIIGY